MKTIVIFALATCALAQCFSIEVPSTIIQPGVIGPGSFRNYLADAFQATSVSFKDVNLARGDKIGDRIVNAKVSQVSRILYRGTDLEIRQQWRIALSQSRIFGFDETYEPPTHQDVLLEKRFLLQPKNILGLEISPIEQVIAPAPLNKSVTPQRQMVQVRLRFVTPVSVEDHAIRADLERTRAIEELGGLIVSATSSQEIEENFKLMGKNMVSEVILYANAAHAATWVKALESWGQLEKSAPYFTSAPGLPTNLTMPSQSEFMEQQQSKPKAKNPSAAVAFLGNFIKRPRMSKETKKVLTVGLIAANLLGNRKDNSTSQAPVLIESFLIGATGADTESRFDQVKLVSADPRGGRRSLSTVFFESKLLVSAQWPIESPLPEAPDPRRSHEIDWRVDPLGIQTPYLRDLILVNLKKGKAKCTKVDDRVGIIMIDLAENGVGEVQERSDVTSQQFAYNGLFGFNVRRLALAYTLEGSKFSSHEKFEKEVAAPWAKSKGMKWEASK